jgi:LPXTG-motif cell wall-anchored protein
MAKRIHSMAMVVLGSLLVMAMGSTAAFAQYPPSQPFSVACIRAAPQAQSIVCSVVGARGGEALRAAASASPAFYTEDLAANADGEAAFRFTVPRDVRDRVITVSVSGAISGEAVTDQITPVTPGRSGEAPGRSGEAPGLLARTGQDTAILVLGGALLLAVGGGAVARSRRRNEQHADA